MVQRLAEDYFRAEKRNEHAWTLCPCSCGKFENNGGLLTFSCKTKNASPPILVSIKMFTSKLATYDNSLLISNLFIKLSFIKMDLNAINFQALCCKIACEGPWRILGEYPGDVTAHGRVQEWPSRKRMGTTIFRTVCTATMSNIFHDIHKRFSFFREYGIPVLFNHISRYLFSLIKSLSFVSRL